MNRRDWLITLLIIVIWGANFTAIKIGLGGMPPMLLAAVRYFFVAFPAVLFVKRPEIEWRYCLAYAMTIGVGQFACLYYAYHIGMPAGLASVIMQSQTFITILLAAVVLKESFKMRQITGLAIAVCGLVLVGLVVKRAGVKALPIAALILTLVSAVFWSLSTFVIKAAANRAKTRGVRLEMFGMVAWSALIPPIPFLAMSLFMDGPSIVYDSLRSLSLVSILCVLFMAWFSTLLGTGVWNFLISKHTVGYLAPIPMLIPVFGLLIARFTLNEQLSTLQWIGSAVIILGLAVFNFGLTPLKSLSRWIIKPADAKSTGNE